MSTRPTDEAQAILKERKGTNRKGRRALRRWPFLATVGPTSGSAAFLGNDETAGLIKCKRSLVLRRVSEHGAFTTGRYGHHTPRVMTRVEQSGLDVSPRHRGRFFAIEWPELYLFATVCCACRRSPVASASSWGRLRCGNDCV